VAEWRVVMSMDEFRHWQEYYPIKQELEKAEVDGD